jgi:hypothetical protein
MRVKQFTASNDVTFTVISLAVGEVGPNPYRKSATHALVEFHDARNAEGHESKPSQFTEHGQFVSYYRLADILGGVSGLMLDTGSPSWRIDGDTMDAIRTWLTTRTLAERIAEDGILAEAVEDPAQLHKRIAFGTQAWTVTLYRPTREGMSGGVNTFTTPFYGGDTVTTPTARDVLECALSDSAAYRNSEGFEDWASEFYPITDKVDERKARAVYQSVGEQDVWLTAFLGDKFEDYLWRTDNNA